MNGGRTTLSRPLEITARCSIGTSAQRARSDWREASTISGAPVVLFTHRRSDDNHDECGGNQPEEPRRRAARELALACCFAAGADFAKRAIELHGSVTLLRDHDR